MVRLIFIEKVFSVYFSHAIENVSIVTIPLSIKSWIFAEISSGNLYCVANDMFVQKSDILLKTYGLNFLGELFEAVTDMNQCWIVWFFSRCATCNFWFHTWKPKSVYVIRPPHLRVDFLPQKLIILPRDQDHRGDFFKLLCDREWQKTDEKRERCNRRKFYIRSVEERLTFCSNEKITMTKGKNGHHTQ